MKLLVLSVGVFVGFGFCYLSATLYKGIDGDLGEYIFKKYLLKCFLHIPVPSKKKEKELHRKLIWEIAQAVASGVSLRLFFAKL